VEKEVQILIIEDDPADALRLMHELGRSGFPFRSERVETKEDFLNAVQQHPPDVILSDHGLPTFSGFAALDIVQEKCPQVPFIFVTGSYDQGMMVEMFESGAAGYVYKNRLTDLTPAIQKALEEKRQRCSVEAGLLTPEANRADAPNKAGSETRARREYLLICSHCKKVRNEEQHWEPIESYLQRQERATVTLALCPDCAQRGEWS
jgi:DNA-binding NtrC family response regulator